MSSTPPDISTAVTIASTITAVVTTALQQGLGMLLKWRRAKQDAEVHNQEMTVRIRISDEYEKLIEQLVNEVRSLKQQNDSQAAEIESLKSKLATSEQKHRECEEKNIQLQQWIAQLEARTAQIEKRQ